MRALVVGGGIAGVSAAAALAPSCDVTLIETEGSLAYHTTGRSAALYFENYGEAAIRPLSRASRPYLQDPPDDLVDAPLLSTRGGLTIAAGEAAGHLDGIMAEGLASGTVVERLTTAQAVARSPVLRPEAVAAALWEPEAADIDVAGLHQSMVRAARRHGADILTSTELVDAESGKSGWTATVGESVWHGDAIVDAAGAWGDVVADRCGVEPVGLTPMRRSAFMVAGEERLAGTPMVIDAHHELVFQAGRFADPVQPRRGEPRRAGRPESPTSWMSRSAIERINEATTLDIRSVRSAWCGLRTFAPDRVMVIGADRGDERVRVAGRSGRDRHPDRARGRAAGRGGRPRRAGSGRPRSAAGVDVERPWPRSAEDGHRVVAAIGPCSVSPTPN